MGCVHAQEIKFTAVVPPNGRPGQRIQVPVNGGQAMVTIPPGVSAGSLFRFTRREMEMLPSSSSNNQSSSANGTSPFTVTVPRGIKPGDTFEISANGLRCSVRCPPNTHTGMTFIAQVPNQTAPPSLMNPANMVGSAPNSPDYYGQSSPTYLPNMGQPAVSTPPSSSSYRYNNAPIELEAQPYDPTAFDDAPIEIEALPVGSAGNQVSLSPERLGKMGISPPVSPPTTHSSYSYGGGSSSSSAGGVGSSSSNGLSVSGGQKFQVVVPQGIRPGQNFEVQAGAIRMLVNCPPNAGPGSTLTIQAPAHVSPPTTPNTSGSTTPSHTPPKPLLPPASTGGGGEMVEIVVPAGIVGGQTFEVVHNGTRIGVKCPNNARGGQKIRIQIPSDRKNIPSAPAPLSQQPKIFQVIVPPGVFPGQVFEAQCGDTKARVQVPAGVFPGQPIQISV